MNPCEIPQNSECQTYPNIEENQSSNVSIKIINKNDDNVVIRLYRHNKKNKRQHQRQSSGSDKPKNMQQPTMLRNIYRNTFGPTLDETLLVGMETMQLCQNSNCPNEKFCAEEDYPRNNSSNMSNELSWDYSTLLPNNSDVKQFESVCTNTSSRLLKQPSPTSTNQSQNNPSSNQPIENMKSTQLKEERNQANISSDENLKKTPEDRRSLGQSTNSNRRKSAERSSDPQGISERSNDQQKNSGQLQNTLKTPERSNERRRSSERSNDQQKSSGRLNHSNNESRKTPERSNGRRRSSERSNDEQKSSGRSSEGHKIPRALLGCLCRETSGQDQQPINDEQCDDPIFSPGEAVEKCTCRSGITKILQENTLRINRGHSFQQNPENSRRSILPPVYDNREPFIRAKPPSTSFNPDEETKNSLLSKARKLSALARNKFPKANPKEPILSSTRRTSETPKPFSTHSFEEEPKRNSPVLHNSFNIERSISVQSFDDDTKKYSDAAKSDEKRKSSRGPESNPRTTPIGRQFPENPNEEHQKERTAKSFQEFSDYLRKNSRKSSANEENLRRPRNLSAVTQNAQIKDPRDPRDPRRSSLDEDQGRSRKKTFDSNTELNGRQSDELLVSTYPDSEKTQNGFGSPRNQQRNSFKKEGPFEEPLVSAFSPEINGSTDPRSSFKNPSISHQSSSFRKPHPPPNRPFSEGCEKAQIGLCNCCANGNISDGLMRNNMPQETRYAITRVTKYDDYTTYEILKSTKARPRKIPEVLEKIFVEKDH